MPGVSASVADYHAPPWQVKFRTKDGVELEEATDILKKASNTLKAKIGGGDWSSVVSAY